MTRRHHYDPDLGGIRRSRARALSDRAKLGPDPARQTRGCAFWALALLVAVPFAGIAAGFLFAALA